ncbi:hypothetical protein OIDMADRAFT_106257 [Oidiodendron maius Zn]|uniref:NAD-dependent epimerase/dehydratase domain-containing protein n=1 Tax=Oidiodendron maius (strain Zn) TaxID=913774 RepID=A0A0C3GZF3_OIDMZ|nr:hypothetical protein OIDMADRAFT_106257 [Oidiodendron maius Zn]
MPIVLVTSASGFIAAHILNTFLDSGYNVRGTVRSIASAEHVRQSHAKYLDRLSFVIVEDITKPGAFDEAVKDVDGVIHTQSPFWLKVENNERDLLIPAIQGTIGILESIHKHNSRVKRIVITSSFAALTDLSRGQWPEHTYSEADWNPATYNEAKVGNGAFAYCASKSLAEKAAWDFVEKNRPSFTVSTILPPVVYGPNVHHIRDLAHLNESSAMFYSLMNGSRSDVPPTGFWAIVDVRDAALAHRIAYEKPEAASQRYFVTAGNFSFQQICDILRSEVPELRSKVPEGNAGELLPPVYKVNNEKAQRELGIQFKPLKEIVVATAHNFLKLEKILGQL